MTSQKSSSKHGSNTLTPSRPHRTRLPPTTPGMVSPNPDGRRRLSLEQHLKSPVPSQGKRKRTSSTAVLDSNPDQESSDESEVQIAHARRKGKKRQTGTRKKQKTATDNEEITCTGSNFVTRKDIIADSNEENAKVKPRAQPRSDSDPLLEYYGDPYHLEGDDLTKAPLSYPCTWCSADPKKPTQVRVSRSNLRNNLKTHRDGHPQDGRSKTGCPGRLKAQKAGLDVPPSLDDIARAKASDTNNKSSLSSFVTVGPKTKFDNLVFNQMMCLWVTSQRLPWNRMTDTWLWSLIQFLRPEARLYGRKWAANESKRLNLSMKTVVFNELKALTSKFSLQQDVWTSKGNRHCFIGAAVTFIDAKWKFVTRHLTLKPVAWEHKGKWLAEPMVNIFVKRGLVNKLLCQTTDSGSNNMTMAREMHQQFLELPNLIDYTWDPNEMHIFCFCHKMALIVGVGLNALGLKTPPPRKSLGQFPDINTTTIEEEDKDDLDNDGPVAEVPDAAVPPNEPDDSDNELDLQAVVDREEQDDDEALDLEQMADDEDRWDEADDEDGQPPAPIPLDEAAHPTHRREANKLDAVLTKVDFILRRITRSAPWRKEFERIMKSKGLQLETLIAAYGIRWNIKYISREKAWKAREVIDQLLKDDLARVLSKNRQPRKNGKPHGYFHELTITPLEWSQVRNINAELERFLHATKRMEGQKPTGSIVIPEYVELRKTLQDRSDALDPTEALYPMIAAMLQKTQSVLDKALACETLVLACMLHPAFRLRFFHSFFGKTSATSIQAEASFGKEFKRYQTKGPTKVQPNRTEPSATAAIKPKASIYAVYSDNEDDDMGNDNQLTDYLRGSDRMKDGEYDISDPNSALAWWEAHCNRYPVIARMAKDYLSCSGASAEPERSFNVAGDVCKAERGKLVPIAIERQVSSALWEREGVPLGEEFIKVMQASQRDEYKPYLKEYYMAHGPISNSK